MNKDLICECNCGECDNTSPCENNQCNNHSDSCSTDSDNCEQCDNDFK